MRTRVQLFINFFRLEQRFICIKIAAHPLPAAAVFILLLRVFVRCVNANAH